MSLKRRILPRVRKSEANSAPVPMRTIVLPDRAKGLRINCPGFSIVVTRKPDGGAGFSVVATKDGEHVFDCLLHDGRYPDRNSVSGESCICLHRDRNYNGGCDDCGSPCL
jgi:hypothetical protein